MFGIFKSKKVKALEAEILSLKSSLDQKKSEVDRLKTANQKLCNPIINFKSDSETSPPKQQSATGGKGAGGTHYAKHTLIGGSGSAGYTKESQSNHFGSGFDSMLYNSPTESYPNTQCIVSKPEPTPYINERSDCAASSTSDSSSCDSPSHSGD